MKNLLDLKSGYAMHSPAARWAGHLHAAKQIRQVTQIWVCFQALPSGKDSSFNQSQSNSTCIHVFTALAEPLKLYRQILLLELTFKPARAL